METRFLALRTIAVIFKILAWFGGVITIILFFTTVAGISDFSAGGALLSGLLVLLIGGFYVLMLYAWAEGILVILAIEENTRKMSE